VGFLFLSITSSFVAGSGGGVGLLSAFGRPSWRLVAITVDSVVEVFENHPVRVGISQ